LKEKFQNTIDFSIQITYPEAKRDYKNIEWAISKVMSRTTKWCKKIIKIDKTIGELKPFLETP
jgi:hypothetical protein